VSNYVWANNPFISIRKVLDSKEGRYEGFLANFSSAEEKVCIELAKS
jgi:hypothetical protein